MNQNPVRNLIGDLIAAHFSQALDHERYGRGSNRHWEHYVLLTEFLALWLENFERGYAGIINTMLSTPEYQYPEAIDYLATLGYELVNEGYYVGQSPTADISAADAVKAGIKGYADAAERRYLDSLR